MDVEDDTVEECHWWRLVGWLTSSLTSPHTNCKDVTYCGGREGMYCGGRPRHGGVLLKEVVDVMVERY